MLKVAQSTLGGGRTVILASKARPSTSLITLRPFAAFEYNKNNSQWFGVEGIDEDQNLLIEDLRLNFAQHFPDELQPSSHNGLILAILVKLYRDTSITAPVLQDLCYTPLPPAYSASLSSALSPTFAKLLNLSSSNSFVKDNLDEVAGRCGGAKSEATSSQCLIWHRKPYALVLAQSVSSHLPSSKSSPFILSLFAIRFAQRRVRLNSVSLPTFTSSSAISALYPAPFSFINHSCVPNAQITHSTDDATLTLLSHDSRTLPEDTEIYIDYMGSFMGKQAKKKQVRFGEGGGLERIDSNTHHTLLTTFC